MAYRVGTAEIGIKPQLEGFRRSLHAQWQKEKPEIERDLEKDAPQVPIEVDEDSVKDSARKAADTVDKELSKDDHDVKVSADVDEKAVKKAAQKANKVIDREVEKPHKVNIETDADEGLSKLKQDLANKHSFNIGLTVDDAELDKLEKRVDVLSAKRDQLQKKLDSLDGGTSDEGVVSDKDLKRYRAFSSELDDIVGKLKNAAAMRDDLISQRGKEISIPLDFIDAHRAVDELKQIDNLYDGLVKKMDDTHDAIEFDRGNLDYLADQLEYLTKNGYELEELVDKYDALSDVIEANAHKADINRNAVRGVNGELADNGNLLLQSTSALEENTAATERANKEYESSLQNISELTKQMGDYEQGLDHLERRRADHVQKMDQIESPSYITLGSGLLDLSGSEDTKKVEVDVDDRLAKAKIADITKPETKHVHVVEETAKVGKPSSFIPDLGTMGVVLARQSMIASAMTGIGIAASGAVPAISGFANVLGNASKGIAVLPALVGVGGAALGTFGMIIGGVSDRVKDLDAAFDATTGELDMAAYNEAADGMSDNMKRAADAIYLANDGAKSLRESFQDMKDSVQDKAFEGIADGLEVAQNKLTGFVEDGVTGMDKLQGHFDYFGESFGKIVDNYMNFRFSDRGFRDLDGQLQNMHGLVDGVVRAVDSWSVAWNNLASVGSQFLPRLGGELSKVTAQFAGWTSIKRSSGEMSDGIEQSISSLKALGSSAKSVFQGVGNVLDAATKHSGNFADQMESATRKFEVLTKSAKAQSEISKYFDNAQDIAQELGKTLLTVGQGISQHLTPAIAEFIRGFGPQLRTALQGSFKAIDNITPSLSKIGEGIGKFMVGLQQFGATAGPVVRTLLPMAATAFAELGRVIGALSGPVAGLIAAAMSLKILGPVLKSFQTIMAIGAGKFLWISALVAAFVALHDSVAPIGAVMDKLYDSFSWLNDKLGGLPGKIAAVTAAFMAFKKLKNLDWANSAFRDLVGLSDKATSSIKETAEATAVAAAADKKLASGATVVAAAQGKMTAATEKSTAAVSANAKKVSIWKMSFRDLGNYMSGAQTSTASFAESTASAKTKMSGLATVAKGKLSGAMTAVKSGAKNAAGALMGLAGGPWMLALGAGVTALTAISTSNESWNKYLKDTEKLTVSVSKTAGDMFDSFINGATEMEAASESIGKMKDDISELADDGPNWADYLGAGWSETWRSMGGLIGDHSGADEALADRQNKHKDIEAAKELIDGLADSNDELARKVNGSDRAWNELKDSLKDKEGGETAIEQLQKQRDAASELHDRIQELGVDGVAAEKAFNELSSSGGQASGDLNKLRGALSGLNGSTSEALRANGELTKSLDSVQQSAQNVSGAMVDSAGNIDTSTTAGMNLLDTLTGLGDAMGNAVESGKSANEVWDQSQGALLALKNSVGMSDDEWGNLLEKMNMTPERLETLMIVKTDAALTELEGLRAKIEGAVDANKSSIVMHLEDQEAVDTARAFGVQLEDIGNGDYRAVINADTTQANANLAYAEGQLGRWDYMSADAFAYLDTSDIDPKITNAFIRMGILDGKSAHPWADLDVNKLTRNQQLALGAIFDLSGKRPRPIADLDNTPLGGSVTQAQQWIDGMKQGAPPVLTADPSGVTNAVNQASTTWENMSFPQKALSAVVNLTKGSGWFGMLGNLFNMGGIIGGFSVGGMIPGLAAGGISAANTGMKAPGFKLPTSGPGTHETDGFVGVDGSMRPIVRVDAGEWVINSKSSAKYGDLLEAINNDDVSSVNGYASGGSSNSSTKTKRVVKPSILSEATSGISKGLVSGLMKGVTGVDVDNVPAFQSLLSQWDDTQSTLESQFSKFDRDSDGYFGSLSDTVSGTWKNIAQVSTEMWGKTQAALTNQMGAFVGDASSIFGNLQTIVGNAWSGIDQITRTDWTNTQNWTLTQFADLQSSTAEAFGNIGDTMTAMFQNTAGNFQDIYNTGMTPVFEALSGSVNQMATDFQTGVNGIKTSWDKLREATAAPVRYTIDTVFNGGLVGMWNSASDILGIPALSKYPVAFATGGHVQGPGTATSDSIPAMLSDGEYVINAKATKQIGLNNLNALNSGNVAFAANAFRDKTFENVAIHRASGGPVKGTTAWKQLKRGYDWARSRDGRPYVWGGSANGSGGADCSGFMSGIADVILGGDGTRQWATMSFPGGQQGAWGSGLGVGFSVGISNEHTAGTIGGVEGLPAVNVESGGSNGGMAFGRSTTVGADDSQFPSKYHMLLGGNGAFVPGMGRAGGVSTSQLAAAAMKPYAAKLAAALNGYHGSGLISQWPKTIGTKMTKAAKTKLADAAAQMQSVAGGAGIDMSNIKGSVVQQVQEVFKRHGWTGDQWDAASWIIQHESGWDPNATNPSSGAYGLFQFLGATKDKYLPGPDYSVPTQANAGARYIKDRYTDPIGAKAAWERQGWYDQGGYLQPGQTQVTNATGKVEPVFNPSQWDLLKKNITSSNRLVNALTSQRVSYIDSDEDEDTSPKEVKPVITIHQWDNLLANFGKKIMRGDFGSIFDDVNGFQDKFIEALENVDWEDIGSQFAEDGISPLINGQVDDVADVLGMPSPKNIPAVKASTDLYNSINETRESENDQATSSQDAYTQADQQVYSSTQQLLDAQKELSDLQTELAEAKTEKEKKEKQKEIDEKKKEIEDLQKQLADAVTDRDQAGADARAQSGNDDIELTAYEPTDDEIQRDADRYKPDEDYSDSDASAEDLADAQEKLDTAKEDLRIAEMKRDETNADPDAKESTKASAEQRVKKAQAKVDKLQAEVDDLNSELADTDGTADADATTGDADTAVDAASADVEEAVAADDDSTVDADDVADDTPTDDVDTSVDDLADTEEVAADTAVDTATDVAADAADTDVDSDTEDVATDTVDVDTDELADAVSATGDSDEAADAVDADDVTIDTSSVPTYSSPTSVDSMSVGTMTVDSITGEIQATNTGEGDDSESVDPGIKRLAKKFGLDTTGKKASKKKSFVNPNGSRIGSGEMPNLIPESLQDAFPLLADTGMSILNNGVAAVDGLATFGVDAVNSVIEAAPGAIMALGTAAGGAMSGNPAAIGGALLQGGSAIAGGMTGIASAAGKGISKAQEGASSGGQVFNYTVNANTVDEGMRRAEMSERQRVAAAGGYR